MNDYNFKAFDKVLVRENNSEEWVCGIYSHYDSVLNSHCVMGAFYNECIPYEGNEHLLGTTDEPKPKRWRAEKGEQYWYISSTEVCMSRDFREDYVDKRHEVGNYFRTKEEAEEMADKFKAMLKGE